MGPQMSAVAVEMREETDVNKMKKQNQYWLLVVGVLGQM